MAYTNPIPLESEIGKYYESDEYISHSNTKKGIVSSLYQLVRNYTLNQKVKLIKGLTESKELLDIGCGTGEFLGRAKSKGFNTVGVEPSSIARNKAIKNYDIKVFEEEHLAKIPDSTVDIVTMWHVLEHVYHLNDRIKMIRRILKPNGKLIIAVPNRNSYDAKIYEEYWAAYDVPRHLYHFTPQDIQRIFSKHSMRLTEVLPMKFDSFYVSMLSEKYKTGSINYLKALQTGLRSNKLGKGKNRYSSQIYIIEQN